MSRYLGIDVGGTASRWTFVGEDGSALTRGVAAGATGHLFNPVERDRFVKMVAEIGDTAKKDIAAVHMGVTDALPCILLLILISSVTRWMKYMNTLKYPLYPVDFN